MQTPGLHRGCTGAVFALSGFAESADLQFRRNALNVQRFPLFPTAASLTSQKSAVEPSVFAPFAVCPYPLPGAAWPGAARRGLDEYN